MDRAGFEPATPRLRTRFSDVYLFVSRFLSNSFYSEFYSWLVNSRGVSVGWARNVLRYLRKPLCDRRDSILAYRLALHFINVKYGVEVSRFLEKLKTKQSTPDLRIPDYNDVLKTYEKIRMLGNDKLLLFFKLLLATGLRQTEICLLLSDLERLYSMDYEDFVVYRIQWLRGNKKVFYAFIPKYIELKRMTLNNTYYTCMAKRHNLVAAKYIRKFVATKMFELGLSAEIIDFIQGRTPRSILIRHYLNLLPTATKEYKKYATWLKEFLQLK